MSERQPKLLVEDIIESAQKILLYTDGMTFDDFIKNHIFLIYKIKLHNFQTKVIVLNV